jgi:xylulokinase
MYLGVDLGTSAIKVILTDDKGELVDSESSGLTVSRPQPLWSEQSPSDWWKAFEGAMTRLASNHDLKEVKAIGLAGQMHGATLFDADNQVIRPAILWNDGRCEQQCHLLEQAVSNSRAITGNIIMPGFTAPKLLWLKQHEPDNFSRIKMVLLPKDYLRFLLTGTFHSDMSDAAGTMWLDVEKRDWHDGMLQACGLSRQQMPKLVEGNQITGHLNPDLAIKWGMQSVPLVAGGGDNAAGAIGVGIVKPGQAMLSLGTSGVYFLVTEGYTSNPESAVHSFCHALPNQWHLMSVLLSAASCLQWFSESIAEQSVTEILAELDTAQIDKQTSPFFLPYLSGERTPHNNPRATGSFFGLTHQTNKIALAHAVLEGVSMAFADGVDALHAAGNKDKEITLIGGGARSPYWRQMLADVLDTTITFRQGGDVGPALGAVRLAQLATQPDSDIDTICPKPAVVEVHTPDPAIVGIYQARRSRFKGLYQQLAPLF